MTRRVFAILAVALVVPSIAGAEAAKTKTKSKNKGACSYLAKADKNAQPFGDQVYDSKIQYREKGKLVKTFELSIITKGMHKMLITFKAPGEVRGMRILNVDANTMYTYLPQFDRVRRVAAHVRNQGFMGTNLTREDMVSHRYSGSWNCQPAKSTAKAWVLDLRPTAKIKSGYSKLRVHIGKKRIQVERVEYYVDSQHVKSQIRDQWQTMQGLEMASRIRFVSHNRNAETTVEMTQWRVNTGVPDSAFSKRALRSGD